MGVSKKILVINLGSTSTKVAVHYEGAMIVSESVSHPADELKAYKAIIDQYDMRKKAIMGVLSANGIPPTDLDCVASRGGNMKPIPGGTWATIVPISPKLATLLFSTMLS